MPSLILPSRFNQQPQQAVQIDQSNPLARGLIHAWIPATDRLIKSGTVSQIVNAGGAAIAVNGSSGYLYSNSAPQFDLNEVTVSALLTPTNVGNAGQWAISVGASPDAGQLFLLGQSDTSGQLGFLTRSSTGAVYTSSGTIGSWASGVTSLVTGVRSAKSGLQNVYSRGVQAASTSVITDSSTAFNRFSIGGVLRDSFAAGWIGSVGLVLIHSRALSDREVALLAENPWQVFKAPNRRLWAAVASTGVTGSGASSEGADTGTGSGTVTFATITGTGAAAEGKDTGAATGTVAFPAITGSGSSTEGADTGSASGAVGNSISGTGASNEGSDTGSGTGTITNSPITGTGSASEGSDTGSGTGSVVFQAITGTGAPTEGADSGSGTGMALSSITGSGASTEAPDIGNGSSTPPVAPIIDGSGAGSWKDVRKLADDLDSADKITRAQKKRRRKIIEAAVLELLPDEPYAERAAPVIAQIVAREQHKAIATWAPKPILAINQEVAHIPRDIEREVREQVQQWLMEQEHLAMLEDDFETELLLLE